MGGWPAPGESPGQDEGSLPMGGSRDPSVSCRPSTSGGALARRTLTVWQRQQARANPLSPQAGAVAGGSGTAPENRNGPDRQNAWSGPLARWALWDSNPRPAD